MDDRTTSPDLERDKDLESLFLSLVENLPVCVARKDRRGKITFANQAFCQLLDLPRESVIGKTDFDFFPKELAEKYRHDDMVVERTGETFSDIEENRTGGDTYFFEVRKTPVRSRDGTVVGTQVIFWDVSAHKRTEAALDQERQLLNALLANTPDQIVFKDAEGRFIRVSRAHAGLMGCNNPADVVGKTDHDFLPADYATKSREDELQVMRSGRSLVAQEEELTWPDGRRTWISTAKAPLRNYRGEVVGTFGISRDITNRKLVEDAQREAIAAAEAANQAKSDFLANMSHEIRTPLNAIIGMTELVLDSELTTTQHDYLRTVFASGETLLGIINQILDFSKIEAQQLDLESVPFLIREVLGDTLKSLAYHAHSKGLELAWYVEPNVPHEIIGDPTRLTQIIVNLVGNAVKFTEEGEVVLRVTGTAINSSNTRLHITVSDTGVGIPKGQQQNIFSAFQQADTSTTRQFGGTGLGLSISSRLSELMGGRIWVESKIDYGSTFHVELYFETLTQEIANDDESLSDLSALVVDDNDTNRLILAENLRGWGVNVTASENGQTALTSLKNEGRQFDVMITDHQMPGMDGVQMIERIRAIARLQTLPIIVLTSGTRRFELPRLRQLGVDVRLLKPIKPSELRTAIKTALGHDSTQSGLAMQPAPQQFVSGSSLNILLAEDGWANQKLAEGLLTKWGHQVTIANNGKEAVDLIDSTADPFSLVLMDVQMPIMDGLEATREIRRLEAKGGGHLPILAMTAHVKIGDEERCLKAGMDGYISKPVRREQLYEAIENIVSGPVEIEELADKVTETPLPDNESLQMADDEIPDIDLRHALDAVEGDEDLLRSVVQVFLEEYPKLIVELDQAIRDKDVTVATRAAHTIKGATRIFEYEPVTELSKTLEQHGREAEFEAAEKLFPKLQAECERLSRRLKAFLNT